MDFFYPLRCFSSKFSPRSNMVCWRFIYGLLFYLNFCLCSSVSVSSFHFSKLIIDWQWHSIFCSCFTTEILEGFDVQRTSGLADTLRNYGYLTQAIIQYYSSVNIEDKMNNPGSGICPPFNEFIKRCQDLDKMTISDVFATQLMQVSTVVDRSNLFFSILH